MTVYNVRLCAKHDAKTYIQAYDDDLAYVSEWELNAAEKTVYNFATDNDGNVYLGWIGDNWLRKFTNEGVADGTASIYEVRDVIVDSSGYIDALTKYQTTQYRIYQRNSDLSARSQLNLDSGTYYSGLVFEDDNIFYTNNLGTGKMEKWSLTDGEKKLVSTSNLASGVSSMGLIGNILGGTYTTTCFTMNKSLTGAITSHTIDECVVTGEIYAKYAAFLGTVEDNFIVVFRAVTEHYLDYGAWFIRRYNGSFTQIGATVVVAIHTGFESHYYRVASKREAIIAEVTTEAASSIGIDHAKGNGTATGEDITERGFEVKLAFSGTLYEYIQRHIAGFSTGSVSLVGTTWVGTIVKTVSEEGAFDAESFIGDLGRFPIAVHSDKLFAGETYDYRARATISGTEYYGEWVEFTTNTYPAGSGPDDQIPIEDIIITEPPIIPEELEPFYIEPEFPPFELPEFEWPEFNYPEMPAYNGSWLGWFYYRKAYTKRDLEELRKKCRIFQDNSVEYALVINHNSRVLQQFLNTMTDYMDADEYNTFKPIIPTQHLNALAREPLNVIDFKKMINNFISDGIDNANNVNHNFLLIRNGLGDYAYTEDEGFRDISITTNLVNDNNPDVDRLKKVVDRLNKEMANNYNIINHNLHVLRSILI